MRECSLGLSKMLSNILCQNALLTKCSFHEKHFFRRAFCQRIWESIFERAKEHSCKIDFCPPFFKFFTIGKLPLKRPNIQYKNSYPHFITAPFIYPHPHPPFAYPHWPTHPPSLIHKMLIKLLFCLPFPKIIHRIAIKENIEPTLNLNSRDMVYLYNSLQVHIIFRQLHFTVKVFLQPTYVDNGLKILRLIL